MSIIDGKEKNWGSRSGKSQKKTRSHGPLTSLIELGVPNEVLQQIITGDQSLIEAAGKLIETRKRMHKGLTKKPKRVHKTKLGSLYHGDGVNVLKQLEDNSLDCVFADPPFNLSKIYGKNISDSLAEDEYLEWTHTWLELCIEKLKPGGAFYVYNIPKWGIYIAHYLTQKMTFKNWIAVDITMSMPIPNRLYPSHYSLLYFIKGNKPARFSPPRLPIKTCPKCGKEQNDYGGYKSKMNPEGVNIRDVWTDVPPVRHSKFKNRDANELHLKILDRVLDISTKEGDIVFDPFGGSGTTFVTAELKNRRWIGSELGNCKPIIERLKNMDLDREKFESIRQNTNTLFTDKALQTRFKSGLGTNKFRVSDEQLERVLGENFSGD